MARRQTLGTDVPLGKGVKDFMDANVCGQIDVYFSGHDHNRQWLDPVCGTEFIVSGTAAKHTDLEGRGNQTKFEDDNYGGFLWVEIRDNASMVDATRKAPWISPPIL